jgi:hypothetical protein
VNIVGNVATYTVTINSDQEGRFTVTATDTVTMGGVTVTRSTGDSFAGDSPSAVKTYDNPSLAWEKDDGSGHPLGGASFIVTGPSFPSGTTVVDVTNGVVVPGAGLDQNGSPGLFELTNLLPGTYTIKESVAPTGYTLDPNTHTVTVTTSSTVFTDPTHFVDSQVLNHGLTPGFWKNNATNWGAVAWKIYTPSQTVGSVFTVPAGYGGLASETLLQALSTGGGGVNALMRQAVAALLNSANVLVDYPLTTSTVISDVNAALASHSSTQLSVLQTLFEGYNNLEGGIDQHGNPI